MKCPKCGKENPDNVQKCKFCNWVLTIISRQTGPTNKTTRKNVVQTNEAEQSYGGISRIRFFLALVGLNIIGMVIGLIAGLTNNHFLPGLWFLSSIFIGFLIIQARLINIGYNQWLALLLLVPLANIGLLAICIIFPEGYKDTRKLDSTGMILFAIFLASIVALIAVFHLL